MRTMQSKPSTRAGKRLAWTLLPIENADQGLVSAEGGAVGMQHIERAKEDKNAVTSRGIVKKRDSQEIVFTEHLRQAPDPNTEVADARPGPSMYQSVRNLRRYMTQASPMFL